MTKSIIKEQTVKCLNCGHEQKVNDTNIYQDIMGKFTVCECCNATYDIEVEIDYE